MADDFPNGTSDAKVTRRNDVVPGDGQDGAADGETSTISWSDPNDVDPGDALQHLILRLGDDVGRVGSLDARPATPTSSDPVWWLATDAGPNNRPVLYRNDDAAGEWVPVGGYLPGADLVVADGAMQLGDGSTETFAESTSPTSWEFTPVLDIHQQTDLDITNGSGSSVTEDVTVELYEGADTTGTLLLSETRSITVSASTTVTETFIATDESLAEATHHIEVATSGTTLSIDNAVETVDEQDWAWDRLADGTYQMTDAHSSVSVMEVDPTTHRVSFPAGGGRSDEEVEDVVNALLAAGANVSLSYDDANDTLTVATPTENIQDAAGGMATDGLAYDDTANTLGQNVVASGQVGLTSGTAVVDTGISAVDATFQLALGIDDPAADAKVAGQLFWDDSVGTYHVEIVEQETTVDPTVNYDIIRVR